MGLRAINEKLLLHVQVEHIAHSLLEVKKDLQIKFVLLFWPSLHFFVFSLLINF